MSDRGFELQGEITMKENTNRKFSGSFRQIATIIVAIGIAAVPVVHAKPKPATAAMTSKHSDRIILVRPTDLPELARQGGEAMLLHETGDGRTLLYVEQNGGTRLAVYDVTDPSHISREVSVQLGSSGPFDFVSPLGDRAELVRFRQGQGAAVLDLRNVKVPTMKTVQGLELRAFKESLGDDGVILANQPGIQSAPDYQVVETANSWELNRVFTVKGVREEITNDNTGTTFLLTTEGLYLIRRPAVEDDYKIHQIQLEFPG
jgi:hypothetical protein